MEVLKLIIELIKALIWPSVIFTVVLMFRKQIRQRLQDVNELELPGGFKAKLSEVKMKAKVDETADALMEIEKIPGNSEEKQKLIQEYLLQEYIASNAHNSDQGRSSIENNDVTNRVLLVLTAGQSKNENLKYNIYYNPVGRNHNISFRYIGLYHEKEVFAVGELVKKISCDYIDGKLVSSNGDDVDKLTPNEYQRVKEAIENTSYYDITKGNTFFLVDKFYETHYYKESFSSLRGKKYFFLDTIPGFMEDMPASKLAELLNGKSWY